MFRVVVKKTAAKGFDTMPKTEQGAFLQLIDELAKLGPVRHN